MQVQKCNTKCPLCSHFSLWFIIQVCIRCFVKSYNVNFSFSALLVWCKAFLIQVLRLKIHFSFPTLLKMMLGIMCQIINIHPVDVSLLEKFYSTSSAGSVMSFFFLSPITAKLRKLMSVFVMLKKQTQSQEQFSALSVASLTHSSCFYWRLACWCVRLNASTVTMLTC